MFTSCDMLHEIKQKMQTNSRECAVRTGNHLQKGDVAALLRSHMRDSIPCKGTIKQTTETMPLALKQ